MTDDVPVQITLYPPTTDVETTPWCSLAPTLWHAGLIWHDYRQMAFELPPPELRVWCTFTDREAFATWRDHPLVKRRCSDLLSTPIHVVEVVSPLDRHHHICACADSSNLVLMGHGFGHRQAFLFCGNCDGYFPDHRAMDLLGEMTPSVKSWALAYGHVCDIWLVTSARLEPWASNELQSLASEINSVGRDYAEKISLRTNKTVWYSLFVESDRRTDKCPACGKKSSRWSAKRLACRECKVVY